MEKSHSGCPRTAWCVVNMFHKNGMSPLIITNGTTWICYSILYRNSPALYIRLKYMYSVISVKLDWLPGNTKLESGESTSSWRLECDFFILGRKLYSRNLHLYSHNSKDSTVNQLCPLTHDQGLMIHDSWLIWPPGHAVTHDSHHMWLMTNMAPPWISFGPAPAGCWKHFGTWSFKSTLGPLWGIP